MEALAFSVNDLCNKDRCKDRYREFANILQDARKKLNQPENQQNVQDIVEIAFYRQLDTIEKKQIVFMLDTCELLNEPGGWEVGRWLIGNLLPTLHKRMGQRCLVVIAGRVLLESAVLQEQDQLRIDLSMFKEKEINEYLELSMFGEKEINEYLELSMYEEKEINEYLKHITKMSIPSSRLKYKWVIKDKYV